MSDLLGFATPAIVEASSDEAFLAAMLDVEAAIVRAGARGGVIPAEAAGAIAACCRADRFDLAGISARAAASASPVVPLVADLTMLVPASAAAYVHFGATSQDVMDTALCLVAARMIDALLGDLAATADRLAALADAHRGTIQIGRTLLQHATPTTFGLVCAGWLTGVDDAAAGLSRVRRERLAIAYGGPVGTLAALGSDGVRVATLLADELGLTAPAMPWHTNRGRIGELAGALGVVAGALGGLALDVSLLAQSDVAEVSEGAPGGSSAMPHKRNPVRAVIVTAAAHRVPGLVASLLAAGPQELQRAAGRWQAEWPVLIDTLRATATAAHHARALVADLHVDAARMYANLAVAGDTSMAESVATRLMPALGRTRAYQIVGAALAQPANLPANQPANLPAGEQADQSAGRGVDQRTAFRSALAADPEVAAVLSSEALDAALRPEAWLGSADVWIDRARAAHDRIWHS